MMRQRARALISVLLLAVASFAAGKSAVGRAPAGPSHEPATDLTVGWVERSQVDGCHAYMVGMMRGQALRILVDQRGVDVRITVDDGADREPLVFDGYTGSEGPDGGLFVARRDGEVRVSVCGSSEGAAGYRIRREELRIASGSDRRLESAYRAYQRGREASEPETRRRAFEEARDGFQATGASREEGWTWYRIGLSLESLDGSAEPEWEEAVAAYDRGVALHETLGDHLQAARMLDRRGRLLLIRLGRPRAALESHREEYRLARLGGDDLRAVRALWDQATCWISLGRMAEAVAAYELALDVARRSRSPEMVCATLLRLGRLFLNGHELRRALTVIIEARDLARKGGYRSTEARALLRMAEVRLEADQARLALALLRSAEELASSTDDPVDDRFDRANAFGRALGALGETGPARAAYELALQLARTPARRVNARINLASLLERTGAFEAAIEHCLAAADVAVRERDGRHAAAAYACIAHNRERQGRLEEALDAIRLAVRGVEELRTRYAQEDLRVSYFADKQRYFDLYLDLLQRLHGGRGDPALLVELFEAAERSRSRALLDRLAVGEARVVSEVDTDLLDRWESLRLKRARLLADQLREVDRVGSGAASTSRRALERLDAELDTLRGRIFSSRPGWREALSLRPMDLETIRARLLRNRDIQIVSYFVGERAALVSIVGEETLVVRRLGEPRDIERLAERAANLLARVGTPTMHAAAERALAELGREVLEPIAGYLTAGTIILVKDGGLDAVPFAGLRLPVQGAAVGKLLGEEHRLVQAPSASAAVLLGASRRRRAPAPLTLAVFADPVYQLDDERIVTGEHHGPAPSVGRAVGDRGVGLDLADLPRLEGARREAEAISEMVDDPSEKLVALGFEANRDAITGTILGRYRMIHFATHGIAGSELSALVLSRWDRSGQPMSRYLLEEWEIYDMELAADLVVLSACRSGRGPRARGEGVLGLARAFLWAGATRVVASLWDVDDEATRHLMTEFYRRMLVHDDPPAEALRRAQASVREDPRWRSPHYWAGFFLQGDGS